MFIKKDTRKIPQILSDATARLTTPEHTNGTNDDNDNQPITELSFARRAPELLSSGISLILHPRHHPALHHLVQLSLYDCGLTSLTDIASPSNTTTNTNSTNNEDSTTMVLFPKLEQLDIGRNPKLVNNSLSDTFHTQLPSLKEIWGDNCSFGPSIPETLLQLNTMEVCRLTGNQLHSPLPMLRTHWPRIKVLALDGNQLSSAKGLEELRYLEKLHLRQNNLTELEEGVPSAANTSLIMIGLSSNKLRSIPESLLDAVSLKEVYLNSNELTELPNGLATKLTELTKLNLAHNNIGQQKQQQNDEDATIADGHALPADFVERFGLPDVISGKCEKDETCEVQMDGNPLSEFRKKRHWDEEKRRAKEAKDAAVMEVDDE